MLKIYSKVLESEVYLDENENSEIAIYNNIPVYNLSEQKLIKGLSKQIKQSINNLKVVFNGKVIIEKAD